jgi:ABC-type spermidine/putrescine transport system permease subunit II
MRHLRGLASIEVPLVSRRVVSAASLRALIATAGCADRFASSDLGAVFAAVPIAVVAPTAEEEHLPTPNAADEA